MSKVALIIIYNHQYINNIERLENIYRSRFTNIFHLMPFYEGEKENVIPVYESSFNFHGYVAQGYNFFRSDSFEHYFFIADDLILNPLITESSYKDFFKLSTMHSFIPGFITLHNDIDGWKQILKAYRWKINRRDVEISQLIPEYEDAEKKFNSQSLEIKELNYAQIKGVSGNLKNFLSNEIKRLKTNSLKKLTKGVFCFTRNLIIFMISKISRRKFRLDYPLVGSYSDIFIVDQSSMNKFIIYCGLFAASDLFVEIAIPTSMVLSCGKINTEKDLKYKGRAIWSQKELSKLSETYNFSIQNLLSKFPEDNIYLHPIKISKWSEKNE